MHAGYDATTLAPFSQRNTANKPIIETKCNKNIYMKKIIDCRNASKQMILETNFTPHNNLFADPQRFNFSPCCSDVKVYSRSL